METVNSEVLEWGTAAQTLSGEDASGDLHVVARFEDGVLAAVIDAIGHGPQAAEVAGRAAEVLQQQPGDLVTALVWQCHERLRRTRGAALSIASFNHRARTMTWLGVGNVYGAWMPADAGAKRPPRSLLVRSGIVGFHLPQLEPSVIPVAPGDTLVVATDGIQSRFTEMLPSRLQPSALAQRIMRAHSKGTDDSLVLVARYAGEN